MNRRSFLSSLITAPFLRLRPKLGGLFNPAIDVHRQFSAVRMTNAHLFQPGDLVSIGSTRFRVILPARDEQDALLTEVITSR